MSDEPDPPADLRDLCAAAAEGRLTPDDARRLEALVLASPDALRYYTRSAHMHAALAWAAGDPAMLRDGGRPARTSASPAVRQPRLVRWSGWAVAAAVVLAAGWLLLSRPRAADADTQAAKTFAGLSGLKGCKWDGGTLPTEAGARLGAGRLHLAEGLATITFDHGAEVRLEGPAEFELKSPMRCVLKSGRLVAKVSDPASHGFTVDTPSAELKDLGTEFGVNVRDGKTSDVQVFSGRVDVTHRGTNRVEQMLTGRSLRFDAAGVSVYEQGSDHPPGWVEPLPDGQKVLTLTTSMGRGQDAYVEPKFNAKHRSDVMVLVKSTVDDKSEYNRKGYLGFDLAPLAGLRVVDAELRLALARTGMGFAAEVPDSTFTVYGLTDESLDGWSEATIAWKTAPANVPGGTRVDESKTARLGSFEVPQGVHSGPKGISGPRLADFLNGRTNGVATFILVRDTRGSGRNDLVHGFANKHHPTLPPPMLKLTVEPK